jgi:glucose dehydrogenase
MIIGQQQNRRIDENALKNAGKTGEQWLTYGLDYAETRYSPLKQIDTTNVKRLGLAWTYEIGPGGGNQEGTPLMANGVIYGITNWSVTYAVDARTGKELWRYDPKVDRPATQPKICCGVVNRGIAIYEDKIFVPVIDGRLVALDASKGTEIWSVQTVPLDQPYTMTMAPRVAKNKVIVGNAGAEKPVRGYFSAYNVDTGKLEWRFYKDVRGLGRCDDSCLRPAHGRGVASSAIRGRAGSQFLHLGRSHARHADGVLAALPRARLRTLSRHSAVGCAG